MTTFKNIFFILCFLLLIACGSSKNTLKNVDENAPVPILKSDNSFVITEMSPEPKYGYDKDYPINIFFRSIVNDTVNQERFLKALAGPNGEKIFYKKIESCCPFPTPKSEIGAGLLDIYEVNWVGCSKPIVLYFNIYNKGKLFIPKGLTARKPE